MNGRILVLTVAFSLAAINACCAADSVATVTEAVNDVSCGAAQASESSPAKTGTLLHDGDYLKTGVKSRAELTLANQTITRMGANTIFNYSVADNQIDLQGGTLLFSKPKDGKEMIIKTPAVTAAIVGTTGFLQLHGGTYLFGIIEGHASLTIGGTNYNITPGEMLQFTPGSPPQIVAFNLPLLVSSSPLLTRFHHHLPNQSYIDKEIAEYNDLVARGFIQPPKGETLFTDFGSIISIPTVPTHDSAGNALDRSNTPPPPPPPPPHQPPPS